MESPETAARLSYLRDKAERGETLTQEEEAEAIRLIRQDRKIAATVSAKSKAAKTPVNPTAVLDKLQAILGKKL
jgi:hypothetical protein